MSADWMEGVPFIFSIVLKLGSSIPDAYYRRILVKDIPENYKLTDDQKETIAAQALDGNERVVFLGTMFASILTLAVVCYKKEHMGIFIVCLVVLFILTLLFNFWMNLGDLGYLETRTKFLGGQIRRATIIAIVLISVDLLLGVASVFLPSAAKSQPAPQTHSTRAYFRHYQENGAGELANTNPKMRQVIPPLMYGRARFSIHSAFA